MRSKTFKTPHSNSFAGEVFTGFITLNLVFWLLVGIIAGVHTWIGRYVLFWDTAVLSPADWFSLLVQTVGMWFGWVVLIGEIAMLCVAIIIASKSVFSKDPYFK